MRAALVILVCALGCGRIDFDPLGGLGDAGAPNQDAMTDAFVACSGYGPWQAPQLITELATADDEWGGQITPKGLALYYQSDPGGLLHIMVARRAERASPFGPAVDFTELDAQTLSDVSPTGDELELYGDRDDGGGACIHRMTRTDTASPWSVPAPVPAFCGTNVDSCGFVTGDGLTMYAQDGTTMTIVVSTRASRDVDFNPTTTFPGLLTGIGCPAVTGDQLDLFVESGSPLDLMENPRASTAVGVTGGGSAITAVDTASTETDVSITADGTELFFSSDRPGGPGGLDLYHAVRACL